VDIYEIGLMMRWIWNNKNSVGTPYRATCC